MTSFTAVLALFPDLGPPVIEDWIARGWVRAEGATPEEWVFVDIDIARIRLIRELRVDLEVGEDALPLVLSLLDQVYGLRRTLKAMVHALEGQPPDVREALLAVLAEPPRGG